MMRGRKLGLREWDLRSFSAVAIIGLVFFLLGAMYGDLLLGGGQNLRISMHLEGGSCQNTCPHAGNKICDEGRFPYSAPLSAEVPVKCDLGTDCGDCGPWKGHSYSKRWKEELTPVKYSIHHDTSVFARPTDTTPSFIFPYTDWKKDTDVSQYMHHYGKVEGGIGRVFRSILEDRCIRSDGRRGLVLDVGANFGYFSLYAAAMGCRVIAWEPVPKFRAFFEWGIAMNKVGHLIDVRPNIVSNEKGATLRIAVPKTGVLGTASVEGQNLNPDNIGYWVEVSTETLDDVVDEDVLLMKVDVEGHEPQVMQAAQGLLLKHRVENILMEYNPHVGERMDNTTEKRNTVNMLVGMIARGYKIGHMTDPISKLGPADDQPFPLLREITSDNLKYDLEDINRVCPKGIPSDALSKYPTWQWWLKWPCQYWKPVLANPKSFRSTFYINTNIWAQLADVPESSPAKMRLSSPVGTIALEEDIRTTWFSKVHPGIGLGGTNCTEVRAIDKPINHCWCPEEERPVCGAEQDAILHMHAAGLFTNMYNLQ
mmetsp:Transcript_5374/g.11801  ORF Transcript_5374/g.11801 Transcript_5374/m.11801 type:complete len:538 (+) Transcript_5374:196-1809(+)|eukprot:CAMPEP_0202909978 /NCGR_PEP_ID=MMETSP1392-20130828/50761_1 /ASSEMBLY_ACC=CAM_ASM_000868 /TAXON_ID=225041 /ORGANISM="Chlamydomonas chlamydogama, Strain SAG 11-48b" /LENGTH=537 /DNA_ID=CAMNT_0049599919 /DNA_START=142 /DNA_END=1755 /DNA_ORIENTATION=-